MIDVNDHSPTFSSASAQVYVREDAPIGTLIYVVQATDLDSGDNGRLIFSVSDNSTFVVDSRSGAVSLVRRLNYEATSRYGISISASDFGSPTRTAHFALFISLLDVNDVAPVFSQPSYSFSAALPIPFGGLIGSVRASDNETGDNAAVTYYLRNGRFGDLFDVRPNTGDIYSRSVFGAGSQSRYCLQIVATDGGEPGLSSTVAVLITLYNATAGGVAPSFSSPQYAFSVSEGQPTETKVGRVGVAGVDRPSFYLLVNSSRFLVVNVTGEVLTREILDRKDGDVYRFAVGVVGQPLLVTYVTVQVLDVNEHAPAFLGNSPTVAHIAENQPPGTSVLQLVATDPDNGNNGSISYFFAGGIDF